MPITRAEVDKFIEDILHHAYGNADNEAATSSERRLYTRIIEALVEGQEDIQDLAKVAIQTRKWTFRRY